MRHSILIVDDERLMTDPYIRALQRKQFHVEHCLTVDCAIKKIITENASFSLVILDVMMPPGEAFAKENTLEGLLTGVFLFQKLRKERPNLPFIVLTNVVHQETLDRFSSDLNVEVIHKTECPPFDLVDRVASRV